MTDLTDVIHESALSLCRVLSEDGAQAARITERMGQLSEDGRGIAAAVRAVYEAEYRLLSVPPGDSAARAAAESQRDAADAAIYAAYGAINKD